MPASKRTFGGVPADVQGARGFVRDTLDRYPVDIDHAALIVGEMATNSIRHAPGPFDVLIQCSGSDLLVGVSDMSPIGPPVLAAGEEHLGTHGMQLVDRLAESWHVEAGPEGKTVWARLRRR